MKHFILDTQRRVIEVDLLTWGRWFGRVGSREIARTEVRHLVVLTSFPGVDIRFGDGPPAFFETRVLDGGDELECLETATWSDAAAGHEDLARRWTDWVEIAGGAADRVLAPS